MTDTFTVFVENGFWYSGYEPHDMPGTWVRTRYKIEIIDGGGMLPNGRHKGMMTGDRLLCIKSGGECFHGAIINETLRDFIVDFDEQYHDDFKAGVKRGYKGKRKSTYAYIMRQSQEWRDGYFLGLENKLGTQTL
jgi:hypothetical protein